VDYEWNRWISTARFAERTAQSSRFKGWSGSAL